MSAVPAEAPVSSLKARWVAGVPRLRRWSRRVAWCVLLVLCLGLRLYHLDQTPAHNATTDEYAWTWSGMSLLHKGRPKGWSNLPAYAGRRYELRWRGHDYKIVEPYLDHPPLYSVYAGGWMRAQGYRKIFEVDLWNMRTGSLPLAALGFVLMTLVLRRLMPMSGVLLSLLFYAVMPTIVYHQRLVVSENLFTPLTLGAVLLLLQQRTQFKPWRAWAIMGLALLLPMTKVAALSSSVFLVMWAFTMGKGRERWLNAGAVVLGTALGLAAYFGYGFLVSAKVFKAVLSNHQHRFRGFGGFEVLLFKPRFINKEVKDLLFVMSGVFALASLLKPKLAPWGLAVLVYAACMGFFVNERKIFGWYFIPLYPWLCAGIGMVIADASRRRLVGLSLLWCTLAWVTIINSAYVHELIRRELGRNVYLLGLLALYGAWTAWPRLARVTIPAVNGVMVAGVAAVCMYEIYVR